MSKNPFSPLLISSLSLNLLLGGIIAGQAISAFSRPRSEMASAPGRETGAPSATSRRLPSAASVSPQGALDVQPRQTAARQPGQPQAPTQSSGRNPGPAAVAAPSAAVTVAGTASASGGGGADGEIAAAAGSPSHATPLRFTAPAPSQFSIPPSPGGGSDAPASGGPNEPAVRSVGSLTDSIDPEAVGNFVHFDGYRVAVEGLETLPDGSTGLGLVLTPEAEAASASGQRGFTEEQLMFRMRWGEEAYKEAQFAARAVANGN